MHSMHLIGAARKKDLLEREHKNAFIYIVRNERARVIGSVKINFSVAPQLCDPPAENFRTRSLKTCDKYTPLHPPLSSASNHCDE
jgi:hypothetical protein